LHGGRWTSPTTEEVAGNLASSKFHDSSGGSRIRRGVGGRLSEAEGRVSFACLRSRSDRVLGSPRAKRAGNSDGQSVPVRAGSVAVPQELLGVPPCLHPDTVGTEPPTPSTDSRHACTFLTKAPISNVRYARNGLLTARYSRGGLADGVVTHLEVYSRQYRHRDDECYLEN